MADPFHLESLDDEEAPPPAEAAGFELAELGELEQAPAAAPAEQTWADILLSGALGVGDGASFGHGDTLGRLGASIGDMAYSELHQQPAATKVGRTAADQGAELSDRAGQTTAGQIGRGAGALAASVPLAAAAGPGVLAQGAMGAAQGAAQAHGDDESMLGGAVAGGALGALGGAVAKGLTSGGKALRAPGQFSGPGAQKTVADEALGALAKAKPQGLAAQVMAPWETAKAVAGQGAVRALTNADKAAPYAQGLGQLGAKAAGGWFGDETASPISWAAQSVLSSGNSGLSPQDEQRMTEAVLSGDKDKLAAADFASAMKSPDYAGRRQEQLQTLQRKDD